LRRECHGEGTRYVRGLDEDHAIVLIGEVQPEHWWEGPLFNRRGGTVARHVGRHTDAVVCRLRFRLGSDGTDEPEEPDAPVTTHHRPARRR
jgi:hypothetical protein